jgi:hypothetical protein
MDDAQKPPLETQQPQKESPVKKPLSIKILQVLFLVLGLSSSSSTTLFGVIIGIAEIMVAWGLFRYTKQSLSMARLSLIVLLIIMGGGSLLLTLGFLSRLINEPVPKLLETI